jgi:hypothetical protein
MCVCNVGGMTSRFRNRRGAFLFLFLWHKLNRRSIAKGGKNTKRHRPDN